MRVLQVTRDYPPHGRGGISTAVHGLVGALRCNAIETLVLSLDAFRPRARPTPESAESTASVDDVGTRIIRVRSPEALAAVADAAGEFLPELIHLHTSVAWPFVERLRETLQVPVVKTIHVAQHEQWRRRGLVEKPASLELQERVIREADAVISPTEHVAELLRRTYPPVAPRLEVIGFGIEESPDHETAITAATFGDPETVLSVGRFGDMNGTAELFQALPLIFEQCPGARFVVVGGLPENRKSERRWLRRFERDVPEIVRARTTFTGWLPAHDVTTHYRRSTLLISTSCFETFGLVVLEAMSAGLPVAGTEAVSELIEDGVTGLLAPVADPVALAANACRLLSDPALRRRLAVGAREDIAARRRWHHVAPDLLRLYEKLVSRASGGGGRS